MTTWVAWPGSLLTNCLGRLPWTAFGVSSPARGVSSPARGVSSPARGVSSPARGVSSPARGVSSPARVVLANWIRLVERRGSDQENI